MARILILWLLVGFAPLMAAKDRENPSASGDLNQPASCTYALESNKRNIATSGESFTVTVTGGEGCKWTASSNQSWIKVIDGTSGDGNGIVRISVSSNDGPQRTDSVAIADQTFTITQDSFPVTTVNAASYANGPQALESLVSAFGSGLALTSEENVVMPVPTKLAGTTVLVRDSLGTERLAPLFYVSPLQVNYQVPPGTAMGSGQVTITNADGAISTGTIDISMVNPGLFTLDGTGGGLPPASILRIKGDGSRTEEQAYRFDASLNKHVPIPIDLGPETDLVFLTLYGTGIRNRSGLMTTVLTLGSVDATVVFAGRHSYFVASDQINAILPRSLIGRGKVDVTFKVDDFSANKVELTFK